MDQTALNSLAARGFARAACHVGAPATQFRPTDALAPCASPYARVMVAFSAERDFTFSGPALWDVPFVYALMDTRDVRAGDILACGADTAFIARCVPFRPPLCVLCGTTITLTGTTAQGTDQADPGGYATSGDVGAQVTFATGWPAMIRAGGGATVPGPAQPGAIHGGGMEMFVPAIPGIVVQPAMWVTDGDGTRYTIGGTHTGPWGTRCQIQQQQV
ncbi:hypothetical protein [Komagataeibacter saccharivorans]|uniref:hypothetical protein n=1 Tax=Komagataeibacter saccharivorans TaxID=265959 RepID=UPI000C8614DA|nr:hypothetical protein [Komagataeibacter saccharivorans]